MRNDIRCGFDTIQARDIDRIGVQGVITKLKERVGNTRVYISVDIDVLDPAFAPGKFAQKFLDCCCTERFERRSAMGIHLSADVWSSYWHSRSWRLDHAGAAVDTRRSRRD